MPDELEQWDEELAAGRLDSTEYRRRRDALLAGRPSEAPGPVGPAAPATPAEDPAAELPPGPAAVVASPDPEALPGARPTAPPVASDPFPPPFRWDPPTAPSAPPPTPDGPPPTRPGPDPAPEEPAERTQFVPGSLAGRWSSPVPAATTAPPWGTGPSSPHAGGPDGPDPADGPVRLVPPGTVSMQGPEVFTRPGLRRPVGAAVGTGLVLLLVVVVLLLSFLL